MVFTSWEFVFFLPLILLGYFLTPKPQRKYSLLAASYFFYGWWDWRFLWLLLFSTLLDYFIGLRIGACHEREDARAAKRWVVLSVIANLSVLAFFKYAGFFAAIIEPLTMLFGIDAESFAAKVILPLGISFYTFQSLSYTVDVYRKDLAVERSLPVYALYVVYFPQLVAGPIERSTRLLPQLHKPNKITFESVREGIGLMMLGFFKKVAIATLVSTQANRIFEMHKQAQAAAAAAAAGVTTGVHVEPVPSLLLLLALFLFLVQIYMDFSGYTDIARGVSKFFGVDLMKNFEQPHLATSLTEFWRRWHISLSSWFRDYLYAPLKGKRRGEWPIHFATITTMTVAGFWHGATWAFLVWGLINGLLLSAERLYNRYMKRHLPPFRDTFALRLSLRIYVMTVTAILTAFFRSENISLAVTHIAGCFRMPSFPAAEWPALLACIVGLFVMIFVQWEQRRTKRDDFFMAWPKPLAALACGIMTTAIIYWSDNAGDPFIYFVF